jgi:putative holliday junction resolvase
MLRAIYNPNVAAMEGQRIGGRVLALDIGKKRIGLAVSDELHITAQGLETIQRTKIREDLQKIQQVIDNWNVQGLLIGKPLHMSGSESRQSQYTEEFTKRLTDHTGLPVTYWDERLTSVEAERVLREAAVTVDQKRKAVDRLAAVLLLESYLDHLRIEGEAAARGAIG